MVGKNTDDSDWGIVRVRKEHLSALQDAASSHPAFGSVEEYLDEVLKVVLCSEQPELDPAEAEALKRHLSALGYM